MQMRISSATSEHKPGSTTSSQTGAAVVKLSADDLPAYCPNPKMPLWSSHPRVFLDVVNEPEAMCPYCGTRYRLSASVNVNEFDTRGLHQHHRHHFLEPNAERTELASATAGRRAGVNQRADAFGNTTLELMTRWLRGRNWR